MLAAPAAGLEPLGRPRVDGGPRFDTRDSSERHRSPSLPSARFHVFRRDLPLPALCLKSNPGVDVRRERGYQRTNQEAVSAVIFGPSFCVLERKLKIHPAPLNASENIQKWSLTRHI